MLVKKYATWRMRPVHPWDIIYSLRNGAGVDTLLSSALLKKGGKGEQNRSTVRFDALSCAVGKRGGAGGDEQQRNPLGTASNPNGWTSP